MYNKLKPSFLKVCMKCRTQFTDETEYNAHVSRCGGIGTLGHTGRPADKSYLDRNVVVALLQTGGATTAKAPSGFATYDKAPEVITHMALEPVAAEEPMGEDPNPPKETLVHALREFNGMGNEPPKAHSDRRNVGRPKKFGAKE